MSNSKNEKGCAVKGTLNMLQQQVPPKKDVFSCNPNNKQILPKPPAGNDKGNSSPQNSTPQSSPKSK